MTLLHRIRTRLRAWLRSPLSRFVEWARAAKIRHREEDLAYSRENADAYLARETARLNALRREHDPRSSDEIVRDVERSAKGFA